MPRLGEVLVATGACTPRAVRDALANRALFGGRLGTNLLHLGLVQEAQLANALSILHGIPTASGDIRPEPAAIAVLSARIVDRYNVVPYRLQGPRITVLVHDPVDLRFLDEIAFATGRMVDPLLVAEARLWELMWKFYGIKRGPRVLPGPQRPLPAITRRTMRIDA